MERRRIWLEGSAVAVSVEGSELVTDDGRRVAEYQLPTPSTPTYFHKPVSALNSHRGRVIRPRGCRYLNYEGEIAIVIGRKCRDVSREEVGEYIGDYTIANDFGIHDFRDTDAGSMLRVKGSDTLCPVGPGVVSDWTRSESLSAPM